MKDDIDLEFKLLCQEHDIERNIIEIIKKYGPLSNRELYKLVNINESIYKTICILINKGIIQVNDDLKLEIVK